MKLGEKLNFRAIADEYEALRSRSENLWPFIFGKMVIVSEKMATPFQDELAAFRTHRQSFGN